MSLRVMLAAAALCLTSPAAMAELKDWEGFVFDKAVTIGVFDTFEIMRVGPNAYEQIQVLSGADLEIAAATEDKDSVDLVGEAVMVVTSPGTHSCDEGNPTDYYVVTLGDVPAPEGPLTTCKELAVSFTNGAVVLEENPMGEGEFWAWKPGKGFRETLD